MGLATDQTSEDATAELDSITGVSPRPVVLTDGVFLHGGAHGVDVNWGEEMAVLARPARAHDRPVLLLGAGRHSDRRHVVGELAAAGAADSDVPDRVQWAWLVWLRRVEVGTRCGPCPHWWRSLAQPAREPLTWAGDVSAGVPEAAPVGREGVDEIVTSGAGYSPARNAGSGSRFERGRSHLTEVVDSATIIWQCRAPRSLQAPRASSRKVSFCSSLDSWPTSAAVGPSARQEGFAWRSRRAPCGAVGDAHGIA